MNRGKVTDIAELPARLAPGARLLGLDVGTKTIGLAVSDGARRLATPAGTIRRTKFKADMATLQAEIASRQVAALIIGLPVNMDGSEGPKCQSVRQFAANVGGLIDLPIVLWDERLSTAAVTRSLVEQDVSRARRKEVVDTHAATYILQGALDRLGVLDASA
jgi:putative holliday junction resolvase